MRFSPKLSSLTAMSSKLLLPKFSNGKFIDEGLFRKLYLFSGDAGSRKFPKPHSFLDQKDLVDGRKLSSLTNHSDALNQSDDSLDFPQLLEVLPKDVHQDERKITSFPLLNPWRIDSKFKIGTMMSGEDEAQLKRSQILDELFPKSNFPSVTRVLQRTMGDEAKSALSRWKEKMVEEMGEVNFIQYQRKNFYRGSLLHRNIALKIKTPEASLHIPDEISGFWDSLANVFPEISQADATEQRVCHPFLCYSGVIDSIAVMGGDLVLIDWKTSKRPKPSKPFKPLRRAYSSSSVCWSSQL